MEQKGLISTVQIAFIDDIFKVLYSHPAFVLYIGQHPGYKINTTETPSMGKRCQPGATPWVL